MHTAGQDFPGLRVAVALNTMDAGLANPAEAEAGLTGLAAWVKDPERLLQMSHRLTMRIGLAQVPRRAPGGWALALVRPGRLGGLRGPVELNRAVLAVDPDPDLGAAPVVVRHEGGLAWHEAWEPQMGVGAVDAGGLDDEDHLVRVLRLRTAERPLPPATPTEATAALSRATTTALSLLGNSGLGGAGGIGERPTTAGTVQLGEAYPHASQVLLDRAMTMLAIVQAGLEQAPEVLPHSHGITARATALEPLRGAALDAIQSAVSWPTHLMV